MQADGQVLIDTKIRTDGMEEGFRRIKDDVGDIASSAQKAGNQIKSAFSGLDVSKPVANARAKVEQLSDRLARVTEDLKLAQMDDDDKSAARLGAQRTRIYDQLAEARRKLEMEVTLAAQREAAAEEKAAERKAKAAEKAAAAEAKAQKKRMKEAFKGLDRAKVRLSEIALGSIIYNTVGQAILSMTKYVGAALKSNDQFSASFARLKGALLTAFQPIYEVVLPALISLMNVLSAVITVIGRFFAALAGKSYSQMQKNAEALHGQAAGIGAVGSAAKKAKKELAGFDEINKLSFSDTSGGGGGGGAGIGEIGADFSDPEDIANLNQILYLVGAIATALLGWKISKLFTDDLSVIAGVAMAAGGAFLMAANWVDAFVNGIDWDNLSGMMAGFALVVGGLALAFGATGAAVGLLVGGVALVVLAVKEWIETGELGEEACMALVVGITAIGVAISLLTGGPLPAIIAAVAAFVIACVTNGDKVKAAFNKVLDWIKGFFLRDWREVFGDTLGSILNGFSKGAVGVINGLKQTFSGLVDFVKGVFTGDWKLALQGLNNIAGGIFGILENILLTPFRVLKDFVYDLARKYLPDQWKVGINAVIGALNKFISWVNSKLKFDVPPIEILGKKIYGGGTWDIGKIPSIPYLAKGAVIPPNAPFLAMLGDQKNGTNIEAPLSTIEEAVENVLRRNSSMSDERIIVLLSQILEAVLGIEIDGRTLSKAIDNYRRKEAVSRG